MAGTHQGLLTLFVAALRLAGFSAADLHLGSVSAWHGMCHCVMVTV
jgi:hypothetical protein